MLLKALKQPSQVFFKPYDLFYVINNQKQNKHMIKGSLVDLLFEQPENTTPLHPESPLRVIEKSTKKKYNDYDLSLIQSQPSKQSSKVIKITQFNSSLIIGEDKLAHKNYSTTSSPQKNFNIKKITEFKNKVIANAQKAVEIQLKKKDCSFNINLKPTSAKKGSSGKQSIDKILVTAQYNIKHEPPTLQNLAASLNLDEEVFLKDIDQQKKEELSDILLGQKFELLQSKDLLAETNQSIKGNCHNSSRKYGVSMFESEFQMESQSMSPTKKVGSPRKMYSRHIIQQKKYQQNLEKEKREILELKKELNKNYAKPFNPPENITAQAYIIYQTEAKKIQYNRKLSLKKQELEAQQSRKMLINSHKIVASINPRSALEIASLTKIMTCIITLEIAQKFQLCLADEQMVIGTFQQNIGGTTANIKKGEIYTIQQLLYGLMLPSGNDASLALAVWGGKTLLQRQAQQKDKLRSSSSSTTAINITNFSKKESYDRFIAEMNAKAFQLNMQKTKFVNSHGLSNMDNKSCAFDLGILCQHAMNNKDFKKIVGTRTYECEVKQETSEDSSPKLQEKECNQEIREVVKCEQQYLDNQEYNIEGEDEMNQIEEMRQKLTENALAESQNDDQNGNKIARWQNSHLLLQTKPDVYFGIKTGVTTTAGPCLASCIQFKGKRFIIIVLNCKSMKHRFKDTENLRKWLFNKEQFKYKEKNGQQQSS